MSALDAAMRALEAAIRRAPDNTALVAERERLVRGRGGEAQQLASAIAQLEVAMQAPGLSADRAAALLAEYERLTR